MEVVFITGVLGTWYALVVLSRFHQMGYSLKWDGFAAKIQTAAASFFKNKHDDGATHRINYYSP